MHTHTEHAQSPAPLCHQLGGKAWCWQLADLPGAFQWPVPAAAHLPSPWPLRKWRMGTLCRSLVGLRCVLQVYVGFCEGTLGLMALTRCQNPAWSLKRTVYISTQACSETHKNTSHKVLVKGVLLLIQGAQQDPWAAAYCRGFKHRVAPQRIEAFAVRSFLDCGSRRHGTVCGSTSCVGLRT